MRNFASNTGLFVSCFAPSALLLFATSAQGFTLPTLVGGEADLGSDAQIKWTTLLAPFSVSSEMSGPVEIEAETCDGLTATIYSDYSLLVVRAGAEYQEAWLENTYGSELHISFSRTVRGFGFYLRASEPDVLVRIDVLLSSGESFAAYARTGRGANLFSGVLEDSPAISGFAVSVVAGRAVWLSGLKLSTGNVGSPALLRLHGSGTQGWNL